MGTYDHKQIISDYATGKLTPEMAIGHSLQHIDKLYEAQTAAKLSRYELRSKVDTLENKVNALQKAVDRLTALVEKFLPGGSVTLPANNKKTSLEPSGESTLLNPAKSGTLCRFFTFYDRLNQ